MARVVHLEILHDARRSGNRSGLNDAAANMKYRPDPAKRNISSKERHVKYRRRNFARGNLFPLVISEWEIILVAIVCERRPRTCSGRPAAIIAAGLRACRLAEIKVRSPHLKML